MSTDPRNKTRYSVAISLKSFVVVLFFPLILQDLSEFIHVIELESVH